MGDHEMVGMKSPPLLLEVRPEAPPGPPAEFNSGQDPVFRHPRGQDRASALDMMAQLLCSVTAASDLERKLAVDSAPLRRPRCQGVRVTSRARIDDVGDGDVMLSKQRQAPTAGAVCVSGANLYGLYGLSKDALGTVRWKGSEIDCFANVAESIQRSKAYALVRVCRELEAKGVPVSGRTVHDHRFLQVPHRAPWLRLMLSLEVVLASPGGQFWLVLRKSPQSAVALRRDQNHGAHHSVYVADGHTPAWAVARQQLIKAGMRVDNTWSASYRDLVRVADRAGLTPADVAAALG